MPWNIQRVDAAEHIRMHNAISYGAEFDPAEHAAAIRDALQELRKDDDGYRNFCHQQSQRANRFWAEERYAEMREQWRLAHVDYWADESNREAQRQRQHEFWLDNDEVRQAVSQRSEEYWRHTTPERREQQAEIASKIRAPGNHRRDGALRTRFRGRFAARRGRRIAIVQCSADSHNVIRVFAGYKKSLKCLITTESNRFANCPVLNDWRIVALCLRPGNFALDAGVFVSNCGLIVNVTPLEPEWEGYLTLEISNTTPLLPRSMPMRALLNCSSSAAMASVSKATKTRKASIKGKWVWCCRGLRSRLKMGSV